MSVNIYKNNYRITYYDLDLHGKVKLSALLRMVHIAAEINANQLGVGFSVLHPMNMTFVLQRFELSIARMPEYDEVVTIRTWPASIARGTLIRKGDMYDAEGNKIMEWASLWLLFDIAARKILKPSALPVELPQMADNGVETNPQKIDLPADFGEAFNSYRHTVRYADADTNMHMNNSIYGDLIGNALFPSESSAEIPPWKHVQINYLAETRLGEEIDVTARREGDTFLIVGNAPGRTAFTACVR